MFLSIRLACLVALLGGPLTAQAQSPSQEPSPSLETIAAELRRQDAAWDDLEVRYQFESEIRGDDGQWRTDPVLRMTWKLTQAGWQRVRRERDTETGPWIEEASYDGEFYMAGDSQGVGSGSVGHQNERFLYNSYVPRLFGLAVTGQELSQPLSVPDFLVSKGVSATPGNDGLITVKGPDLFAEGVTLELELDPAIGYRPRVLKIYDEQGALSTYDELKYRQLTGSRGKFWFPESGVWKGVDPENRTEASRLTYRAQEIRVDTKPSRTDFVLTYRSGALLLNTDTGETVYLKADSTPADVPGFAGKRLSLAEHDRQAERTTDAPPVRQSRWNLLMACNLIGIVVLLIVLFSRSFRKKRDA